MKNRIKQPYGYTGREHDRETGLRYYRARYYDGEVGRFISEDPIGFAGGDVNLYTYVFNEPIGLIDPRGLSAKDKLRIIEESQRFTDQMTRQGKRIDPGWINNIDIFLNPATSTYEGCQKQSELLWDHIEEWAETANLDDEWTFRQTFVPIHYKLEAESSSKDDPVLKLDPHANSFGVMSPGERAEQIIYWER